ncbi:G-protein coupled receptor 87-like [Myxocyprinus asiaticus]|uniref:G-protein coupled receptor 87-like n=1 Tax=Myxocyprinus asiaticus TaxID=70543 RepID=UPI002221B528|nr:G-protein coupled receptor 87-like [Myxocyprinus asiaticus]
MNITNSTEGPCEMPARPFFICIYTLIFLASLVLNSITIHVYFCKSTIESSITVYLKNLAVADLFVCLCLLLRIFKYAYSSVEIQRIYCNFGAPASYLNMYCSIFFMGYIAVNRYLRIVKPMETYTLQTVRSSRYICLVTWAVLLCAVCVYIVVFISSHSADKNNSTHIGFDCDIFHSDLLKQIYLVMHVVSFFLFLFVLVSLVLLYWWTIQRLQQAQHTMPALTGSTKLSKSKRNMLVLVTIFCVCFVPYHLVRLAYTFKPLLQDCASAQTFYILKEITVLLAVLNASLDPIIYFVFCNTFRAWLNL